MANLNNSNLIDSVIDAQRTAVDTMVENSRKLTNGNNLVTETVNKSSEWYKNWLDNQKNVFSQTSNKANETAEKVQEGANQANEYFQNWYNNLLGNAKQMWDMNASWMSDAQQKAAGNASNPMDAMKNQWNNMNNQYSNWMNSMKTANTWNNMMNQFQTSNPFSKDAMKDMGQGFSSFMNQWTEMMSHSAGDWQKNLQAGTIQDAYRNMVSNTEGFAKFYEMWMPMMKSINNHTFNMDVYKKMMNPAQYKELMDKFFGFMPDNVRNHMQQMTEAFRTNMQQMGGNGMGGYQQMRDWMSNMMPMQSNEMFGQMMHNYTNMYAQYQQAMSPINKMMTQNEHTKSFSQWQDLANRTMMYNIKNAEMQYMMYNQGTKVMDKLAERVAQMVQNGEEVTSMMSLYQDWIKLSDSTFVELFESDEYSEIMAETSAMQMKLRKDMDGMMEKALAPLPVATRSELDELYKTIYDLKKEIRQMAKMMDITGEEAPVEKTETTPTMESPKPEVAPANQSQKSTNTAAKTTAAKK